MKIAVVGGGIAVFVQLHGSQNNNTMSRSTRKSLRLVDHVRLLCED